MLLKFNLYDLFVLSFVQLVVSTVLVLSPAREIGTRFRWTGSRITEVVLGSRRRGRGHGRRRAWPPTLLGPADRRPGDGRLPARHRLGRRHRPAAGPQRRRPGLLRLVSPRRRSPSRLGRLHRGRSRPRSIAETLTASLVILLDLAAFLVWISNINYVSDVLCRTRRSRPLPEADPELPADGVAAHPGLQRAARAADRRRSRRSSRSTTRTSRSSSSTTTPRIPAVWRPGGGVLPGSRRGSSSFTSRPGRATRPAPATSRCASYTDPRAEIIGLVDADDIVQPYYLRETAPVLLRSAPRLRPDLRGQPGLRGQRLLHGLRRLLPGLLPGGHVLAQRARHGPVRRHDGPVPRAARWRRSAAGTSGASARTPRPRSGCSRPAGPGCTFPRCFGRGIVPPTFAGLNTQRHRWCFGAMQILRLHWRSLMPWDRSPDNHLTARQRRDYLMASLGWFRDLLMLAFACCCWPSPGCWSRDSGFAVAPLDGDRSLLPMSLIIIATICMMWTLRHWTTMSLPPRGAVAGDQPVGHLGHRARLHRGGGTRRDGVFLRTSKSGGRRTIFTALRLSRWETVLAVALYVSAGLLAGRAASAVAAHLHHLRPGHRVPVRPDRVGVEPAGPGGSGARSASVASPSAVCAPSAVGRPGPWCPGPRPRP